MEFRRTSQVDIRVIARAKINLCLHVTGRRPDGFHAVDSLVAFPMLGDRVSVRRYSRGVSLCLDRNAPFADSVPKGDANIALRAGIRLAEQAEPGEGAEIRLEKRIPVAAGLGGGSADAATVLLALRRLWTLSIGDDALSRIAFDLGADVPVCLVGLAARVRGAGERIEPVRLPPFWCVLAWPGYGISTKAVFDAFAETGASGSGLPDLPDRFTDCRALADWLRSCRNDLHVAAEAIAPGLPDVREVLENAGALYTAMSGSGSAHWGMFASETEARQAASVIGSGRSDWWCEAAHVVEQRTPAFVE